MNGCTDLIKMPELESKCYAAGRKIETTVRHRSLLSCISGTQFKPLTKEELHDSFGDIMVYARDTAAQAAQKSAEEAVAVSHEMQQDIQREKKCEQIRAQISESYAVSLNDQEPRVIEYYQIPKILTDEAEDPSSDIRDMTDSELLDQPELDNWKDCMQQISVKGPDYISELAFACTYQLSRYFTTHHLTVSQAFQINEKLHELHLISASVHSTIHDLLLLPHGSTTSTGKKTVTPGSKLATNERPTKRQRARI